MTKSVMANLFIQNNPNSCKGRAMCGHMSKPVNGWLALHIMVVVSLLFSFPHLMNREVRSRLSFILSHLTVRMAMHHSHVLYSYTWNKTHSENKEFINIY